MKKIAIFLTLLLMVSCKKAFPQDPTPVHESFSLFSQVLDEKRVINVWLPPNYANTTQAYPVLYMPDGGIQEDFPHIANTLAELIAAHKIPPMILVGIENTNRRRDLTGASQVAEEESIAPLSDGASVFRTFIKEELITEINHRYRTTSQKGIIGESLAGLFVVETLWVQPDLFDFYIAMDPSLWWNNHYLVKEATTYLSRLPDREIKFWFAGSDAIDISQHTQAVAQLLKNENYPTLRWFYADMPNEKHHTIYRATKVQALEWVFQQ